MKKLGLLFAILVMSFMFAISASANTVTGVFGAEGSNLIWSFDDETGMLEIRGTGDMTEYSSWSNVPWYNYRRQIKTVNIDSGVTNICKYAFYDCQNISAVTIPNSVKSIGYFAFEGCKNLKNIIIPDGVTFIDTWAFSGCSNLTSINIPKTVTNIGDSAFSGCSKLTEIIVDEKNQYYSSDEYGVLFNKDKTELLKYPEGNTSNSYIVPSSVKKLYEYSFRYCSNLKSVEFPDSITDLGEAFYDCYSLERITIPNRDRKSVV